MLTINCATANLQLIRQATTVVSSFRSSKAKPSSEATSIEPSTSLSVRVLGNPMTGNQLQLKITGAQGQLLRLSVRDAAGRVVVERQLRSSARVWT